MTAEVRRFECNEAEARTLTEDIRRGVERVHQLLVRSYEWRAWDALGYATWADYAMAEFDMSRSYAYRLLNQSQVIAAIEAAATESPIGDSLTESQTRELAPIVRDHGPEAAASVLRQVVASGEKPTAAAIRQKAEDTGLRPVVRLVDRQTGEILPDTPRPVVTITVDPEQRDIEQRRAWLRKLSDGIAATVAEADTVTHTNNRTDVREAFAAYPPSLPSSGPITPTALRATAARLVALADTLEKP